MKNISFTITIFRSSQPANQPCSTILHNGAHRCDNLKCARCEVKENMRKTAGCTGFCLWRIATSREILRDASRVNIRTRCSRPLNWRKDRRRHSRGGFTRGEEPRSEIVNTFSHSPIFRATTAQPLVKSHASSRLPRIGAPPFRRPLRHSIVRFRAPTTPESRERNDQALCTGACCSPTVLHFARAIHSPRSASRFPGTHTFGMPRSDAAALLLRLRKSCTLSGDHFYTLSLF